MGEYSIDLENIVANQDLFIIMKEKVDMSAFPTMFLSLNGTSPSPDHYDANCGFLGDNFC